MSRSFKKDPLPGVQFKVVLQDELVMLVISRKLDEKVCIGVNADITVQPVLIEPGKVKLCIVAPGKLVFRLELLPVQQPDDNHPTGSGQLVLSRMQSEEIVLGDSFERVNQGKDDPSNILLTIVEIRPNRVHPEKALVRIGIKADRETVPVFREELLRNRDGDTTEGDATATSSTERAPCTPVGGAGSLNGKSVSLAAGS